jgi:hypothetical protein
MTLDDAWQNPRQAVAGRLSGIDNPLSVYATDYCPGLGTPRPFTLVDFEAAKLAWKVRSAGPPKLGQSAQQIAAKASPQLVTIPRGGPGSPSWTRRPEDCEEQFCDYPVTSWRYLWGWQFPGMTDQVPWKDGFIIAADARCDRCYVTASGLAKWFEFNAPRVRRAVFLLGTDKAPNLGDGTEGIAIPFDSEKFDRWVNFGIGYEPCVIAVKNGAAQYVACGRSVASITSDLEDVRAHADEIARQDPRVFSATMSLGAVTSLEASGRYPSSLANAPQQIDIDPRFAAQLRAAYRPERETRISVAMSRDMYLRVVTVATASGFQAEACWELAKNPDFCWKPEYLTAHSHPAEAFNFFSDLDISHSIDFKKPILVVTKTDIFLALPTNPKTRFFVEGGPGRPVISAARTCEIRRIMGDSVDAEQAHSMAVQEYGLEKGVVFYRLEGGKFIRLAPPKSTTILKNTPLREEIAENVFAVAAGLHASGVNKIDDRVPAIIELSLNDREVTYREVLKGNKEMHRISAGRIHPSKDGDEFIAFNLSDDCQNLIFRSYDHGNWKTITRVPLVH